LNWVFGLMGSLLFLSPVRAQEECPVEVKLLLSSPVTQPVVAALGFKKRTESQIYFFDTESLDLLRHGVIVRIRQDANYDLTVKLRPPKGSRADDNSLLRSRFSCEIDRTRAKAQMSYAVGRKYRVAKVPEMGTDVYGLLSASQKNLLHDAGISIDWARVVRIASINSTKWQTPARSPYGILALELWEWPAGKILEISAKAPPGSDSSKYEELARLLEINGVSLNANQDTKTATVLETLGNHPSPVCRPAAAAENAC
jgi:hypothetical protein